MSKWIAAVIYREQANQVANGLWAVVDELRQRDVCVGGLLNLRDDTGAYVDHSLVALLDGAVFRILNNFSADSVACRLNPAVQAQAAVALEAELAAGVQVLFINKFGVAEAEGSGFFDQFVSAVSAQVPVVSMVEEKYLPAWREFVGELGEEVPLDGLLSWVSIHLG